MRDGIAFADRVKLFSTLTSEIRRATNTGEIRHFTTLLNSGRNGLKPYKQPPLFEEYLETFRKRIDRPLAPKTVALHENSLKALLKVGSPEFSP
jgi:hypothetical protein